MTKIEFGHFKSAFAKKALSRRGKAIPWFTYPAIDFLVTRDFSAPSILEFGGGQSTKFWGGVARDVTTFETDAGRIEEIKRISGAMSRFIMRLLILSNKQPLCGRHWTAWINPSVA